MKIQKDIFSGDKLRQIYIIPYSHCDFAYVDTRHWHIWRFIQIFKEVVDVMDKNKSFTYLIDNVAHNLRPFIIYAPNEFKKFRSMVKKGRIGIANGGIALARLTSVGEETFIRNMVEGKKYMENLFGITNIDFFFNADTGIGHSQLPQILSLGGHKYYRSWRPEEALDLKKIPKQFWWKGIDGSTILVSRGIYTGMLGSGLYMNMNYNENWNIIKERFYKEELLQELVHLLPTDIAMLNCGCDFGRPLRNYIDTPVNLFKFIKEWNKREKVKMKFSTPKEYFDKLSKKDIPVYEGVLDPVELKFAIPRMGNDSLFRRRHIIDRLLIKAETLTSFANLLGVKKYPENKLSDLWGNLFEIIGHAMDWVLEENYNDILSIATKIELLTRELIRETIEDLAMKIKNNDGEQYVIFNTLNWVRNEVVKLHVTGPFGVVSGFDIYDVDNNKLDYQIVDVYREGYKGIEEEFKIEDDMEGVGKSGVDFHEIDVCLNVKIPPMGYTTLRIVGNKPNNRKKRNNSSVTHLLNKNILKTTDEILINNGTLEVILLKGLIKQIKDTRTGRFIKSVSNNVINDLIFAKIKEGDNWLSYPEEVIEENHFIPIKWKLIENGPIRWIARINGYIQNHFVEQEIILNYCSESISFNIDIDSPGAIGCGGYFASRFPTDRNTRIYADIPFGVEERNLSVESYLRSNKNMYKWGNNSFERGWVGQFYSKNWITFKKNNTHVAIISENCTVYRHYDESLHRISLILGRIFPKSIKKEKWIRRTHPYVEGKGKCNFNYMLYFMKDEGSFADVTRCFKQKILGLEVIPKFNNFTTESIDEEKSFFSFDKDNVIISSFYKEDKAYILRIFEAEGKGTSLCIKFAMRFKNAYMIDFMGKSLKVLESSLSINHNKRIMRLTVKPWQIINIKFVI